MTNEKLKKALVESAKKEYFEIDKSETYLWELSENFVKEMELLVKQTKKRRFVSIKKVLLVAAVVVLVSCMIVFSSADVREDVINYFKEQYDTHFDLEYGMDNAGDIQASGGIKNVYTFAQLPSGFEQSDFTKNLHSVVTVWENAHGDMIILSQGDGITKRSIDNERLVYSKQIKDGVFYEIYTGEDYLLVLWTTAEYTFSVDYYGKESVDEIISIIGSIAKS